MAVQGRKLSVHVETTILDALREGQTPQAVAIMVGCDKRTIWRVRREYGLLTPRTGPRRKAFLLLDAILVPYLAVTRSLPQAERRARQLALRDAGNDPRRVLAL